MAKRVNSIIVTIRSVGVQIGRNAISFDFKKHSSNIYHLYIPNEVRSNQNQTPSTHRP